MPKLLSRREIFRPTLGRILFSLIPIALPSLVVWIVYGNVSSSVYWIDAVVLVPFIFISYFLMWGMMQPFQIVLGPLTLWDDGFFASPAGVSGYVIVVISYVVIFYFAYATRKILVQEVKKIFSGN